MSVARNVGYALEVRGIGRAARNWPFGAALSMIVMAVVLAMLPGSMAAAKRKGGQNA